MATLPNFPLIVVAPCAENNVYGEIAGQYYVKGGDGLLMPTHKAQPPPDLRYFKPPQK